MDTSRLVRGFESLESAAAAVNALCEAGVEHGAIGMLAAAAGVYLVIVEPTHPAEADLVERVLAGIGRGPAEGEPLPARH